MIDPSVLIALALIVILAVLGVHVVLAFMISSTIGLYLIFGSWEVTIGMLRSTAFNGIRDYNLMVIPLFAVMGLLMARSGAAGDLYAAANRAFRRIPGRLAVATIGGNALFAAVTGVGVAAAAAFSHIAYPPMMAQGYRRSYAAGCIAGSSVLGLLIPPSVFMIVWAVLTEQSIGRLFAAGVLPGLLLAGLFMLYCMTHVLVEPGVVKRSEDSGPDQAEIVEGSAVGVIGVIVIIFVTLGGIWFGYFTPTEGSGIGLLGALVLSLVKRQSLASIIGAFREAGMVTTPIMLLLLSASMYSQLLALAGVPDAVGSMFASLDLGVAGTLLAMVIIWMILGCFIDSISIMLLTVPIFWPIAAGLQIDPMVFAMVGILVIEAGVLTPPFGIGAFVVRAAISDTQLSLADIFRGLIPYWILILFVAWLVYTVPSLVTMLPSLL